MTLGVSYEKCFLKYLDLKVKPLSVTGSVEKPGSPYLRVFSVDGSETLVLKTVTVSYFLHRNGKFKRSGKKF